MAEKWEWNIGKGLRAVSIAVGVFGIALSIILFIIIFVTLDDFEGVISPKIVQVGNTLEHVQQGITTAENEIDGMSENMGELKTSIGSMQSSMNETGKIMLTLGLIDSRFVEVGHEMIEASEGFGGLSESLGESEEGILVFKQEIEIIRRDITAHQSSLVEIREMLVNTMGMLKIGVFLYLLMNLALFGMLILNALSGMVPSKRQGGS